MLKVPSPKEATGISISRNGAKFINDAELKFYAVFLGIYCG
ncbi:hypothetical protein [uncultured Campylobacter sp.]|nr:hypothetical protein [uncultured Campylobacter sp.]